MRPLAAMSIETPPRDYTFTRSILFVGTVCVIYVLGSLIRVSQFPVQHAIWIMASAADSPSGIAISES